MIDPVQKKFVVIENGMESKIQAWLKAIGLNFDPFSLLEASADPYLNRYMVGHEASFISAWGDSHSLIYAPAGGGKTALRARIAQACWIGQETNRPFSLAYIPPYLRWGHISPSLEEHLSALVQTGAQHLLLALAHRPHWFLRASSINQRCIKHVLDHCLPGLLDDYLNPCVESRSLDPLREHFSPASLPPEPPEFTNLLEFFNTILKISIPSARWPTVFEQWESLLDILLNVLNFPAVYILLDSLDAVQEVATAPSVITTFLSPIIPHLKGWAARKVYLKGFIPIDAKTEIEEHYPTISQLTQSVTIEWNPTMLAELIRRRVYVASEGAYGSLGPLASPDIRDLETTLAKISFPLPREMLVLTRQVLVEHIKSKDQEPKITEDNIQNAAQWYQENRPNISGESYLLHNQEE